MVVKVTRKPYIATGSCLWSIDVIIMRDGVEEKKTYISKRKRDLDDICEGFEFYDI